jgi:protoporphyrinogen IX oxidase
MIYLSLKTLHIIAVISWMAGLLYLPRLFIYHFEAKNETSETFKIMERRLFWFIMTPAMLVTLVTGFILAGEINAFSQKWFHVKLLFVLALAISHFYMQSFMDSFAKDERPKSTRFFRLFNEIPTLLMIFIVIFVVFKPLH